MHRATESIRVTARCISFTPLFAVRDQVRTGEQMQRADRQSLILYPGGKDLRIVAIDTFRVAAQLPGDIRNIKD
jgi:hypothetical protein